MGRSSLGGMIDIVGFHHALIRAQDMGKFCGNVIMTTSHGIGMAVAFVEIARRVSKNVTLTLGVKGLFCPEDSSSPTTGKMKAMNKAQTSKIVSKRGFI